MKRPRQSAAQIIAKLRDTDGMLAAGRTIGEVCQVLGTSEGTLPKWPLALDADSLLVAAR
jgi:putative transposase